MPSIAQDDLNGIQETLKAVRQNIWQMRVFIYEV